MRDPELVARAQRAATRLESAWEQWRALRGLAVAPGQPVVSYAGVGRRAPDQVRGMAPELASWTCGELPAQVTDQLAAWPPPPQTGADQPPASV